MTGAQSTRFISLSWGAKPQPATSLPAAPFPVGKSFGYNVILPSSCRENTNTGGNHVSPGVVFFLSYSPRSVATKSVSALGRKKPWIQLRFRTQI